MTDQTLDPAPDYHVPENRAGAHGARVLEAVVGVTAPQDLEALARAGDPGGMLCALRIGVSLLRNGMNEHVEIVSARLGPLSDGIVRTRLEFSAIAPVAVLPTHGLDHRPIRILTAEHYARVNTALRDLDRLPLSRLAIKARTLAARSGYEGVPLRELAGRALPRATRALV